MRWKMSTILGTKKKDSKNWILLTRWSRTGVVSLCVEKANHTPLWFPNLFEANSVTFITTTNGWIDERKKCQKFSGPKKIGSRWRGGQRQELSPSVLRRRMIGIRRRRYCRSIPLSLTARHNNNKTECNVSYQTKTVCWSIFLTQPETPEFIALQRYFYCLT